MESWSGIKKAINEFKKEGIQPGESTPGELIESALKMDIRLSDIVIAESIIQTGWSINDFFNKILKVFDHNLKALECGLSKGNSFLLDRVAHDLASRFLKTGQTENDELIKKAVIYTLATEVGNHEMGLMPCAGTGDSCPYTGLLRALSETENDREEIKRGVSVLLKVGTVFRAGKTTTGCNMEGYGAGAAATAACLTEIRRGTPEQVEHAVVLALSPTIAVPCTPRVMVAGLCANHIASAITTGNNAAVMALNSSMRVDVSIDAMISMAAEIHKKAAPVITAINIEWMKPYFKTNETIDNWINSEVLKEERDLVNNSKEKAVKYMKHLIKNAPPIIQPFGDVVVGGSSMAVGSPTNMGRIVHELIEGDIEKIKIELTLDLFARRAINIPGILMGAILGARTDNIKAYKSIIDYVQEKGIKISIVKAERPEAQNIYIKTNIGEYSVISLNRGGGRITIIDALPSINKAIKAAQKLGIVLVE